MSINLASVPYASVKPLISLGDDLFLPTVTTIELVVTTVESVRDSKSGRTSLLNDTIVRVKL